jgi:CTP-dependent riboflavin kinase
MLVSVIIPHRTMYNPSTLCRVLRDFGFREVTSLRPGETMIPYPGALNLRERDHESLYVEAKR